MLSPVDAERLEMQVAELRAETLKYRAQAEALKAVLQHMDPTAQATARHDLAWNLVFLFTGAAITALAFWL